jgi:hypothetical protein
MKQSKCVVSLSDRTTAIILGSLLGDGSLKIHSPYKNARFSFRHSVIQKEYFNWKAEQLKEIASAEHCVFSQKPDGYSAKNMLRFQSRALESLTELYQLTHKKGGFKIRRKWLNLLTPLSLAIWWFDDGSVIANGRKGVLCTDGFTKDSVKILSRYLQVVWHVKTQIAAVRKKKDAIRPEGEYWRIWFRSTSEFQKFLQIIVPYTPVKEMLYKIVLLYKDPQLQQRWISELTKSTNFSQAEIAEAIQCKKNKWKNFRE